MSVPDRTERWLAEHRQDLVDLTRELVSFRSENRPPDGGEGECQRYVADRLKALGMEPDMFEPDTVEGATDHADWWPGRTYRGRPCVSACIPGAGQGRSLLLSGHVDVVPALGEGRHGFWDGEVDGGLLYGRGAWDMKGSVACALHAARCLVECGVELAGDLLVETVVDEEFGGANGTLACRIRGHEADAAVLGEPTGMAVCHATRGGIQYRLHAAGGQAGMGFEDGPGASALVALARVSAALDDASARRAAPILQYLLASGEELPWGTGEGQPTSGELELWAEIVPGTDRAALDAELRAIVDTALPDAVQVHWEQRTRFLPAYDVGADAEIVGAMARALGTVAPSDGVAPFACDAFMLAATGMPVVVCGPRGGNAHAPDEFVVLDDLHALTAALVRLAVDWCGEEEP